MTPEEQVERLNKQIEATRARFKIVGGPDTQAYDIIQVCEVGDFLVAKVKYESCPNCTYEGEKVMVFRAKVVDALRWRSIAPHFRAPSDDPRQAPSPLARFPATDEGWRDAYDFALRKK